MENHTATPCGELLNGVQCSRPNGHSGYHKFPEPNGAKTILLRGLRIGDDEEPIYVYTKSDIEKQRAARRKRDESLVQMARAGFMRLDFEHPSDIAAKASEKYRMALEALKDAEIEAIQADEDSVAHIGGFSPVDRSKKKYRFLTPWSDKIDIPSLKHIVLNKDEMNDGKQHDAETRAREIGAQDE